MTRIVHLERFLLVVVFLATLVPIAARGDSFGLPLYGVPLLALLTVWLWRSLSDACLDAERAYALIPFVLSALLLGLSTFQVEGGSAPEYCVWATGLLLMAYANQNWGVTIGFRFVAWLAILVLSVEVAVSFAQIATQTYVGNAVMYFGRSGDIADDIREIAGGRVFRPVGTVGLPNMLSILIVMMSSIVLPVVIGAADFARSVRVYAAALVVAGFAILVYSTSRGNIIAMVGLPVLFFAVHVVRTLDISALGRNAGTYLLSGIAGCIVLAGLLMFALQSAGSSPFLEGLMYRLEGIGTSARFRLLQYWHSAAALIDFPILGMGFGESAGVWDLVEWHFPGKEDFSHPPHNSYIILALEGGLLAGVVYASALLWLAIAYPARALARNVVQSSRSDVCIDGMYIALFMFVTASVIYIAPMSRSLWPVGCFVIGLMQAQLSVSRRTHRVV